MITSYSLWSLIAVLCYCEEHIYDCVTSVISGEFRINYNKARKPVYSPMYDKSQVTRLWCSSICQAIWIGDKVCSSGNYYCPAVLCLIRSQGTMRARDRRWQDTKEYPTIVPWSLIKRHLRDCLVAHLKSPRSLWYPLTQLFKVTSQCPPWNKENLG